MRRIRLAALLLATAAGWALAVAAPRAQSSWPGANRRLAIHGAAGVLAGSRPERRVAHGGHATRARLGPPRSVARTTASGAPDPARRRIFTVAGGGTRAPADGLRATDARLRIQLVAAFDHGGLALVHDAGHNDQLYRIAGDGLLRRVALPVVQVKSDLGIGPARVVDLDARPDGALVLALADRVWQLAPGTATWVPLPAFANGALPGVDVNTLAATTDGRTLVAGEDAKGRGLVWLLADDGRPLARYRPPPPSDDDVDPTGLVSLPDGGFAFNGYTSGAIVRRDGPGAFRRLTDGLCCEGDLGAFADGSIMRAVGMLTFVPAAGPPRVVVGAAPGLGSGDGGPARSALLDARLVDVRTDGSWLVGDAAADPRGPIDRTAFRWRGRAIITEAGDEVADASLVRFAGEGDPGVPTVALLPVTYDELPRGTVAYHSSFAGQATLTIRSRRGTVLRVSRAVAPGDGRLQLPARLPTDDYRLELRVSDGRAAASHRLAVSLVNTLSRRRARRLARRLAESRSDGGDAEVGSYRQSSGCRRESARRFACAERFVFYYGDVFRTRCDATIIVALRRDGARAYPVQDIRRCRQLLRRAGTR
jgi:hypothetical protein